MAAPVAVSTRRTPGGTMLEHGHDTTVSMASNTTIKFEEVSVTPPALSGGSALDTTTQYNAEWRTMGPRHLKTLEPLTFECAYDPTVLTEIDNAINAHDTFSVQFSDALALNMTVIAFFGYIQSFTPGAMSDDGRPTATVTIQPINRDASGAEFGPTILDAAAS